MDFERKRMMHIFKIARTLMPYDELPVVTLGFDPQVHASRNDRPQPFFLVCDHDTTLATLTGRGIVELKSSSVLYHSIEPGDFVYVPAGTPHRIVPSEEMLQVRYKAAHPALEGVAWYCERCSAEVYREDFSLESELPQEGYARISEAYNASAARRTCGACGQVQTPADLGGIRWREVAAAVRLADADSTPHRLVELPKKVATPA